MIPAPLAFASKESDMAKYIVTIRVYITWESLINLAWSAIRG